MATHKEGLLKEIKELQDELDQLESQRRDIATADKVEKLTLDARIISQQKAITAKQETLTVFLQRQLALRGPCRASDLISRIEALEIKVRAFGTQLITQRSRNHDPRLRLFRTEIEGSQSTASEHTNYGDTCFFCGSDVGVSPAHIITGDLAAADYSVFGRPRYRDDLDVKSARNFIPLCGSSGDDDTDTCHNEFNKYLIVMVPDPFKLEEYTLLCLRPDFAKYAQLHRKVVVTLQEPYPYRRLSSCRNRKALLDHGISAFSAEIPDIVRACNLSETANSIAIDDDDTDDDDAGGVSDGDDNNDADVDGHYDFDGGDAGHDNNVNGYDGNDT